MRLILMYLLFIFCFLSCGLRAQEKQARDFIDGYFRDKEPVLYTNDIKANEYLYDQFKEAFSHDTLRNNRFEVKLVLTAEERAFILKEASKPPEAIHIKYISKKSRFIPRTELDQVFKDKIFGWQKFNKEYGHGFYSFYSPIFLRDNTLCVFYVGYNCGLLCGNDEIGIYKKVNGKWIKWFTVYHSVS
jgi:hypothetical protein